MPNANNHPKVPGWKYVRTLIPPTAHDKAVILGDLLGWSLPRVYTAALNYFLLTKSTHQQQLIILRALGEEPPPADGMPVRQ